ncbi:hypothetical protein B4077_1036 [Bacillus cereus]|uniref:Uncharacterized protein n=1 Tax=Bacillus cereus TaxID=1396 RepID=A0A0G8F767_BACCE|nr:hypothetical protein B4077_1036 [Bacillus cereus]
MEKFYKFIKKNPFGNNVFYKSLPQQLTYNKPNSRYNTFT